MAKDQPAPKAPDTPPAPVTPPAPETPAAPSTPVTPSAAKAKDPTAWLGPRLPEPQMILDSKSYELKQLAREIAERELDPLNIAKRPGGYYLNEAGHPIDCNGNPIPAAEVRPEHQPEANPALAQDAGPV